MNPRPFKTVLAGFVFAASVAALPSALACATCFGASDSDLARGMNWGILSLLVVVVGVLGAFGTFFVYVARRSAQVNGDTQSPGSNESSSDPS